MRHLIIVTIILSLSFLVEATDKKPNILLILADDWSFPHASVLGDKTVQTPVFDRIAKEGVLFSNAHVSAPSCAPSRAAILTGQWHWRLEEGANLCGFIPAKHRIYTDILEENGYFVGCAGKGYDPGDYRGRKREPAGDYFDNMSDFLSKRPKDKPFCFWLGSRYPHRPYNWNQREVNIKDVKVPPFLPDDEQVRKDIAAYYNEIKMLDKQAGEAISVLDKAGELDNTFIVFTSDNGWPFPKAKATCYLEGTRVPFAIRWGKNIKPGRTVEDFISLADLAPTFLDLAGVKIPQSMTNKSFLNVIKSNKSGLVDSSRDHILTGMERHTWNRSMGNKRRLSYPIRTIVTKEFHYIRNFKPQLWPVGDPNDPKRKDPPFHAWRNSTFVGFSDVDSGLTKAYMAMNRKNPKVKPFFDMSFGMRPAQELYDLKNDPYEMNNLVGNPEYTVILNKMDAQLTERLKETQDPRIVGRGGGFDTYPIIKDKDPQNIKAEKTK